MLNLETKRGVQLCDGMTRRDFLRVGGLTVGVSLAELAQLQELGAAPKRSDKSCIQLFLVGGPSQLETWDLKPEAPDTIRGPFRPIKTNVAGIHISEHFPRMARMADRFAVLRSLHHEEAPIHETGHQLMQTGNLFRTDLEWPHYGAVASKLLASSGAKADLPPWVVLPKPLGNTGVSISHGQTAGFLGKQHEPFVVTGDPARLPGGDALVQAVDAAQRDFDRQKGAREQTIADTALASLFDSRAKKAFDLTSESEDARRRYGLNTFGQSCLLARRLVEHGVRLVTVNMFDTVFNQVTWDCHANGGDLNSTLDDYKETLCPMLDTAYTALLDDLKSMGLLDSTLVLCMGEFGRTPRINNRNGRDHWPGVWSMLMAGGGVKGGQAIGSSDREGAEPRHRPIHPSEIAASVYHALGIDSQTRLTGPEGRLLPLVEARPVMELF